ncbi:MAG: helix-turn-helix domain-containing protein [Treponema sp.]|jgi:excisionase family DNA binding protein|nr:helix-turn-helix domain-containing protein [Treponema sp.]
MPQFVTVSEFISATRISRPTVSRRISTGEIPAVHLGSRVLIPASFLNELEEKARSPKQPEGVH